MRSTWVALTLLAAGCFSESPTSSGCIDGEAACDCKTDSTCDDGLECVASIDKCVPTGCTPGSESCTCVDDACLTGLVCDGGVCIPPSAATTGGDASMTTATTDTTPVTITATPSDPSDSTSTPEDTSATDPTGMSSSMSTDPSDTSIGEADDSVGSSETSSESCPVCIDTAGDSACGDPHDACANNADAAGCKMLMSCIVNHAPIDECCAAASPIARAYWNELVDCAQTDTCTGACQPYCE